MDTLRDDVCRLADLVAWLPAESRCARLDAAERPTEAPQDDPEPVVDASDEAFDDFFPKPPTRR